MMPSLGGMSVSERDQLSYRHYVSQELQLETTETLPDAVEKMLCMLLKHERRVVRLYYLREMRLKEIGKHLGVSVNTIKSRLRRATAFTGANRHVTICESYVIGFRLESQQGKPYGKRSRYPYYGKQSPRFRV